MTDKLENPPAFPLSPGLTKDDKFWIGMSMRDYFAAAALQGMNANPELFEEVTRTKVLIGDYLEKAAENAYRQADCMLKARGE